MGGGPGAGNGGRGPQLGSGSRGSPPGGPGMPAVDHTVRWRVSVNSYFSYFVIKTVFLYANFVYYIN